MLPPYGACLLGSINLTAFVTDPFTEVASFDWDRYIEVVRVFTRMLDNVVDINRLPLPEQRKEILDKRRHGMGYLGLGSAIAMCGMKYGDAASLSFTTKVTRVMAEEGWRVGYELAKEKGKAPILEDKDSLSKFLESLYITNLPRDIQEGLRIYGSRFTHHTSIAPTGTIALSIGNNCSNGIEPSFSHKYKRNVITEGKASKEQVDVYSYECLMYGVDKELPDYFVTSENIPIEAHIEIQAAAQEWIDSSISKTINVPTDYPFDKFKNIYQQAYDLGLKGCTTFRFNPEVFSGVLVKEEDLANTTYEFKTKDKSYKLKGNEKVMYEGEEHIVANLYDAIKEGYYGKY